METAGTCRNPVRLCQTIGRHISEGSNFFYSPQLETVDRDSDFIRAWRSGDRIWVEARFFAPVQTGPRSTPPPVKWVPHHSRGTSGRDVALTTQSNLALRSKKEKSYVFTPPVWLHGSLQGEIYLLHVRIWKLLSNYYFIFPWKSLNAYIL
jgi:hypothetical protein